jgi:HK97 gp10 family phage protein
MTVRILINSPVLDAFLTDRSYVSASKAATKLRDDARRRAPRRTGAGAASIEAELVDSGRGGTTYRVGPSLKYMEYQENGTGPIRARPGRVLRFKAGGVFVFARRTKGVPARHFMRDAYLVMSADDFNTGA